MRLKEQVNLKILEQFRYQYQANLLFPTYQKVIKQGKSSIIIEILICNRTIFINRNKILKRDQLRFLRDLMEAHLVTE